MLEGLGVHYDFKGAFPRCGAANSSNKFVAWAKEGLTLVWRRLRWDIRQLLS